MHDFSESDKELEGFGTHFSKLVLVNFSMTA